MKTTYSEAYPHYHGMMKYDGKITAPISSRILDSWGIIIATMHKGNDLNGTFLNNHDVMNESVFSMKIHIRHMKNIIFFCQIFDCIVSEPPHLKEGM